MRRTVLVALALAACLSGAVADKWKERGSAQAESQRLQQLLDQEVRASAGSKLLVSG